MAGITAFFAVHREVELHLYATEHGFNCEQRETDINETTTKACERALTFFAKWLA